MKKWKKAAIGFISALLIVIIILVAASYHMVNKSIPTYDGQISVAGIKSEVNVYRNQWGIPLISANSDEDAAFAIGYVHAQERLFQMDIARRAGAGRLSEILGEETVPIDKMFRTVGIEKTAEESFPKLNPLSQKILIAYTKGVNSFINEAKGNYQVEFDALGYDPYAWKPEHSLIIAKLMAWELNISWWTDLLFTQLVQKFGEEKAKELIPSYPQNAPTIIPSDITKLSSVNSNLINVDKQYRSIVGLTGTHIGSNNWVVNSAKSNSGRPIIANDPHLGYTAPGRWTFIMIRSKDWNAEGFSIAGLPAVVIGKNKNIAWAMTNVMADDADFYREKLDSSQTKFFFNNQWKNLFIYRDTIIVKGGKNVFFDIKKTARGPIISGIHPLTKLFKTDLEEETLSLRWTGMDFSDELYAALLLNKAANWNQFTEALRYYTVPGQNFVYADAAGNIGYVCAAKIPIRANNSPSFVFDGTSDAYDWKGYVPYDQMPKLFNPSQNFVASANNKTVQNFPFHISNIWEPSSRFERITELLTSKEKHSVEDYKKYQMDFISPYAKMITKSILAAFKDIKIKEKNLSLAMELLNNWNFEMDAGSQVPTIYSYYLKNLIKNIFMDEMDVELLKEFLFVANVPYRKIEEILNDSNSLFWDNKNTPEIETMNSIIRKSLVEALSELENSFGKDAVLWQWGMVHKVTFKHMFNGNSSLIDKIVNIGPFDIGGDGTTLFNTEYSFTELFEEKELTNQMHRSKKFENKLGPSMRYIFDFANPDYLEFIMPTGQAGHIFSNHYSDMSKMWLKGKYIKLSLREEEFIRKAKNQFKMVPN